MSNENPNSVTTETGTSSNGVGHSKPQNSKTGTSKGVSVEELAHGLEEANRLNAALLKKLNEYETAEKSKDSGIDKLTLALTKAISGVAAPKPQPIEDDVINRTNNFVNSANIDGRSLMEAQETQNMFRREQKFPISIPKTFANQFGPSLAITVNGCRVSIPCDGKTYYINETHYIHAKERLAKVDRLLSDTAPNIIETDAS